MSSITKIAIKVLTELLDDAFSDAFDSRTVHIEKTPIHYSNNISFDIVIDSKVHSCLVSHTYQHIETDEYAQISIQHSLDDAFSKRLANEVVSVTDIASFVEKLSPLASDEHNQQLLMDLKHIFGEFLDLYESNEITTFVKKVDLQQSEIDVFKDGMVSVVFKSALEAAVECEEDDRTYFALHVPKVVYEYMMKETP